MTRHKKTRKTGPLAARSQPKNERQREEVKVGKDPSRSKGKPAGQRHTLDVQAYSKNNQRSQGNQDTDPRKGSKRPVKLVVPVKEPEESNANQSTELPNAHEKLEFELEALENDAVLQELLDNIDEGEVLSEDDQAFVDEQLTRYRELVELLGIEDSGDDEEDS